MSLLRIYDLKQKWEFDQWFSQSRFLIPKGLYDHDQIGGRFQVSKPTVHQLSRCSRQPRYTHCTVLLLPHIFFCNSLSTLITYPNLYVTGTIKIKSILYFWCFCIISIRAILRMSATLLEYPTFESFFIVSCPVL